MSALPHVIADRPDLQRNFDALRELLPSVEQHAGVAGAPTTTSGTYAVLADLTATRAFTGRPVLVAWVAALRHSAAAANVATQAFLDGVAVSKEFAQQLVTAGANELAVGMAVFTPTVGSHTVDIRWKTTSAGTLTSDSDSRTMVVIET